VKFWIEGKIYYLLNRFANMFVSVFKCLVINVFIFVFAISAEAQQTHFVYLQAEGGRPFYVKINNKVISSSAAGYLILPKLTDGDYKLSIGFPKKEFPEENYQVLVDKKNEGFLLKNFGEKGWGLFNIESYNVIMGGNTNVATANPKKLQDDPFSKMLANVVKDSSILQKNETIKEERVITKVDSVNAIVKNDSVIHKIDSANAVVKKDSSGTETEPGTIVAKTDSAINKIDSSASVAKNELPSFSPATLLLSKKNKDGMEVVYIDHVQNRNDTIRIFIPAEKQIANAENPVTKSVNIDTSSVQNEKISITSPIDSSIVVEKTAPTITADTKANIPKATEDTSAKNNDSVLSKKTEEVKQPESSKVDSIIKEDKKMSDSTNGEIVVLPKVVTSSKTNSDCKAFADNGDFLKLRKKMASENSDDNMIKVAKKAFRTKCFSTEQIKNLSFLFLTDEGKYKFFDEFYAFASDSDQYYTLQSQLTDSYYINRFKAMIHK
jgi:hypothetical protein